MEMAKVWAELPTGLVGLFFHFGPEDKIGVIHRQGRVISRPEPGLYLVQLYEFSANFPTDVKLVRVEDMMKWCFYQNSQAMLISAKGIREGMPVLFCSDWYE